MRRGKDALDSGCCQPCDLQPPLGEPLRVSQHQWSLGGAALMQAKSSQVALERGKSLAIPGWWRHLGFPSTTGKRPVGVVVQDVSGPTSGQVEDDHVNGGS